MDRSAVVVLAAGRGARFGSTKQLAVLRGRPLVAHAVAAAHAAGAARVVVVVGADAERVAAAARSGGEVEVVHNPRHAAGQSTSLAAGIGALIAAGDEDDGGDIRPGGGHPAPEADDRRADIDIAVLVLADQPGISPGTFRRVVAALAAEPERDAARARYADGPGHPVAFRRSVWPQLRTITGDHGARHLLETLSVVDVEVAAPAPRDVDTPADLDLLGEGAPGREPDGK
jgi:molybdenum cofactor cytidylyltransferase